MAVAVRKAQKVRLNVRFPAELVTWAKGYAKERNTTVTQLLVDYLTDLKKKADAGNVEQV